MTPATVGDAILQDIIAHPEADDLRQIYADWLEEFDGEHGAIRATFIRDALTRPAEIRVTTYHRRDATVLVEGGTLADEVHTFAGDLPIPAEQRSGISYGWRRGFVSEVACACDFWLQHGPRLAQKWPLERVKLTDKEAMEQGGASVWGMAYDNGDTRGDHHGGKHWIPQCIHNHLPPSNEFGERYWHPTDKAANHLSIALLAWARSVECLACNDTGRLAPALGSLASFCECDVGQALLEKDPAYQAGRRAYQAGQRVARDAERRVLEAIQGTWPRTGGG